jgi:MFS transporter, PAT family, beta-lactamase induction signal transducer AmpG
VRVRRVSAAVRADGESVQPAGAGAANAPWLFGLLSVSFGLTTTVSSLLMPYLLRQVGVPVERIAYVGAIALVPSVWSFLWAPLADCGMRRRSWVLLSAAAASLAGASAVLSAHGSVVWLAALLFLSNASIGLHGAATGALMCALPPHLRGRSAGWSQAGNIGAGAVGGGMFIWLLDQAGRQWVAVAIVAATILPSLAAVLIDEPAPVRRAITALVTDLFQDMRSIVFSRRTWLGVFFFVSPAGSFALVNLISGLAPDFRASGTEVAWITGVGGGLLTAAGSFAGGHVADRVNRMVAYSLAGGAGALAAAYLAVGPATALTYGAAFSAYALMSGFSFCMFTALVLDVVGPKRRAAATAYTLLNASGNLSITYMVWLDGVGYKYWGVRGLLGTDALIAGASAATLLLVALGARRYWSRSVQRADG